MTTVPEWNQRELSVGELAARSGVAASALHFYERKGLIANRAGDAYYWPKAIDAIDRGRDAMHQDPDSLPIMFADDAVEMRSAEWGSMFVTRYTLQPGTDLTPYFADYPDGLCSAEHWGMVLQGALHLRYANGEVETTGAGEIYHFPAGHTGWTDEGVIFLAFTPAA